MKDRDTLIRMCEIYLKVKDYKTQHKLMVKLMCIWAKDIKMKVPTVEELMEQIESCSMKFGKDVLRPVEFLVPPGL